jgi:Ran GTPase-activating protein (RanGAP) involved in mRNA processing and transport
MSSINFFDLSDTAKYSHRTDLCLGIRSILASSIEKNVHHINLSDNFLDVDGARAFASFLEENTTLEDLQINNCSLGQKSCEMVLESLDKNKNLNLKRIGMNGNEFGKDGMEVLAQVLDRMKPEHIELRDLINPKKKHNGLTALLSGLKNNCSLIHLDVSGNHYNDQISAVDNLLAIIGTCEHLRTLGMNGLGFDKTACHKFIDGLL